MTATIISSAGQTPAWLEGIEGREAQELIESDSKVIRVVAGPGSGKTTCLKRRLQRLVEQQQINPERVFAGTFTRAIARELRDALGEDIRVSTLHSLAYELLRTHPHACQGMSLRFLLRYEEDALLYDVEDAASGIGNIHKRRDALRLLQASRAQRTQFANAKFDGAVRRWLQRHRAMLIGEVVHLCVVGLESHDIAPGMFDHVVVDEYQDLTAAEQELVRLIWSGKGSLTVLGDNNQSIYGFRFNHPEGIADFHLHWPGCDDLTFADNRRCGAEILKVANLMMAEAGSSKPPMQPKSQRVGSVKALQWETLEDEIDGLASYVRLKPESSFLILVPRRFIGYRLAEAIGSDVRTAFAEQVLDHPIAQEAFATVSLLADPEDFVAARSYLGLHGTNREQATRRNSSAYSTIEVDLGGHDLVRRVASGDISVSGSGQSHISTRARLAVELIDRGLTPEQAIDEFFDTSLADGEPEQERRRWLVQDLLELRTAAHELLALQDKPDLAKTVATMRYRIATRAPLRTSDTDDPRVKIMTLHSAKGLEADNVVVAGVADQFMPGEDVNDSSVVAEQRRLLYVAVTRARDSLIISWPRRIQATDVMRNKGRWDRVITKGGIKWAIASRSRLLPQGLGGVIAGKQMLASLDAIDAFPPGS